MNSCLVHIINLATQALISTRSKAKYYDSSTQEADLSDIYADILDEVGLIRAICVKVCTSCLHKHPFTDVLSRLDLHRSGKNCFTRCKYERASNPCSFYSI